MLALGRLSPRGCVTSHSNATAGKHWRSRTPRGRYFSTARVLCRPRAGLTTRQKAGKRCIGSQRSSTDRIAFGITEISRNFAPCASRSPRSTYRNCPGAGPSGSAFFCQFANGVRVMRFFVLAVALFSFGAAAGAASVHSVYTAPSVFKIETTYGSLGYPDTDRRALRSVIRSEVLRARMARR